MGCLSVEPAVAQQVVERVLPAGLVLVRSPLLQVRECGARVKFGASSCILICAQN
jgi:ribosomal protein L14